MPVRKGQEGRESGFAVLMVFLLLAFIGIAMYNELPRVVLEAQRDREQLLIDRGEQYKRAIQLYYRKFQRYPPDLDALDNTNNIRFLRKRYKDPMTGEDNWRLVHAAGPGVFLDSLVNAPPASLQSQTQTASTTTTTTPEDTPTPIWLQRRPSDMIIAGDGVSMPPMPGAIETVSGQQPSYPTPATPVEVASTGDQAQPPDQGQPNLEGAATLPGGDKPAEDAATMAPPPPVPTGPLPPGQAPAVPPGFMVPVAVPGQPAAGQAGPTTISAGTVAPGAQATNPALQMINQLLTTPNPRGAASVQAGFSGVITQQPQQQLQTGIAGVASKLESDSIKVYNERSKYNEWEFLYDVRQDPQAMAAGRGQQGQQGQQGPGGAPGTIGPGGPGGRGGPGGPEGPGGPGGRGGPGGPGGRGGPGGFGGPGGPGGPGMFGPGTVISPGGLSPQSPGRGR